MSDANETQLGYIAEENWGEIPATPELKALNFTRFDLKHSKLTVQSQTVRADATIQDLIRVGEEATGGFEGELTWEQWRPFIEGAVRGEIVHTNIGPIEMDIVGQTLTAPGGTFTNVPVGSWVMVSGATTPNNNGPKRVTAVAGGVLTFTAGAFSGDETDVMIKVHGYHLTNGIAKPSFVFEKRLSEAAEWIHYLGCMIDTMAITFNSRAIATIALTILGQKGVVSNTIDNDEVYTAQSTDTSMDGSNSVSLIKQDGHAVDFTIKSLVLNTAANLRGNDGLAQVGLAEIGHGTVTVTGTITAYHRDMANIEKFIEHESTALQWRVENESGTIIFTIPKLYFTDGDPAVEGLNTDLMEVLPFTAVRDSDGVEIQIDFLPA